MSKRNATSESQNGELTSADLSQVTGGDDGKAEQAVERLTGQSWASIIKSAGLPPGTRYSGWVQ
jgi:hypothetical protein